MALSRLIDAQQQSQHVNRRREKEKKKDPRGSSEEVPGIELALGPLARFQDLTPAAQESAWHGCRKEPSDLLLWSPDIWMPRLHTVSRIGRSTGRRIGLARYPCGDPRRGGGVGGGSRQGQVAGPSRDARRTGRVVRKRTCLDGGDPAGFPPDGSHRIAAGAGAGTGDSRARGGRGGVARRGDGAELACGGQTQASAKPMFPRDGGTPGAFPRAAPRVVAVEAETGSGPAVRAGANTMLALAAPAPRREPARRRTSLPVEDGLRRRRCRRTEGLQQRGCCNRAAGV